MVNGREEVIGELYRTRCLSGRCIKEVLTNVHHPVGHKISFRFPSVVPAWLWRARISRMFEILRVESGMAEQS